MTRLEWDKVGERLYETGVDHGVLYVRDNQGAYPNGVAWNGLTTVTESPSGAEASPQYADNIKYLNLTSNEEYGATIEAFTYPDEFAECDGTAEPIPGLKFGQQPRKTFGFAYRTLLGNDVQGNAYGYKLHLIYGASAAPSEKARTTINDSPEATPFSWEVTTTPATIGTIAGVTYAPTAKVEIDSTKVNAQALADLEAVLYGTEGEDPRLPTPAEVHAFFAGTVTEVTPTAPTQTGDDVTIPTVTGVVYTINGEVVTGVVTITEPVLVKASPASGYKFPNVVDNEWVFEPEV